MNLMNVLNVKIIIYNIILIKDVVLFKNSGMILTSNVNRILRILYVNNSNMIRPFKRINVHNVMVFIIKIKVIQYVVKVFI